MRPIEALAEARRVKAAIDGDVKALRAQFDAEHADLLASQAAAASLVADAEANVKSAAMAVFIADGIKKQDGCEVKMFTVRDYPEADAFAWAKETGLALALDKKAFEKIASVQPLDFVTVREEPKVTISSDLSAFVP